MPRAVVVALVGLLALGGCAGDDDEPSAAVAADSAPVAVADPATAASYVVPLVGTTEVPGPGDPDGAGEATISLAPGRGEVCFRLTVTGVEPTGAHLHEAPAGQPGPAVLALPLPASGTEGCASADERLLVRLAKDPGAFYVNVHSAEFPDGAVRGQLG